jgi:hypothetical protein
MILIFPETMPRRDKNGNMVRMPLACRTHVVDGEIVRELFMQGMDTARIADYLRIPEYHILEGLTRQRGADLGLGDGYTMEFEYGTTA